MDCKRESNYKKKNSSKNSFDGSYAYNVKVEYPFMLRFVVVAVGRLQLGLGFTIIY